MGRPIIPGISKFSQSTNIFNEKEIGLLIRDHGAFGFMIFEFIKCHIFRTTGYFAVHNDQFYEDIYYTMPTKASRPSLREVVSYCLDIDLFSKEINEREQILTSDSIQKAYNLEKKRNKIKREYMTSYSAQNSNAGKNPSNAGNNGVLTRETISNNKSGKNGVLTRETIGEIAKISGLPVINGVLTRETQLASEQANRVITRENDGFAGNNPSIAAQNIVLTRVTPDLSGDNGVLTRFTPIMHCSAGKNIVLTRETHSKAGYNGSIAAQNPVLTRETSRGVITYLSLCRYNKTKDIFELFENECVIVPTGKNRDFSEISKEKAKNIFDNIKEEEEEKKSDLKISFERLVDISAGGIWHPIETCLFNFLHNPQFGRTNEAAKVQFYHIMDHGRPDIFERWCQAFNRKLQAECTYQYQMTGRGAWSSFFVNWVRRVAPNHIDPDSLYAVSKPMQQQPVKEPVKFIPAGYEDVLPMLSNGKPDFDRLEREAMEERMRDKTKTTTEETYWQAAKYSRGELLWNWERF